MKCFYKFFQSPVGLLKLVANDKGLIAVLWENDDPARVRLGDMDVQDDHPILLQTEEQLKGYFAGTLRDFSIPLDFNGTDFQREVWNALLTIPFGETRSYQDISIQIHRPQAVRAVGAANGKNPISIIAPCHRVIGMNGQLTGFAGGLEVKEFLLNLEGSHPSQKMMQPTLF